MLDGAGLEVQLVGGVVVGRHRLGVAVDHHRGEPRVAHGEGGVAAAVVELDALADTVGAVAEHHDAVGGAVACFVFVFVGAVQVRSVGLELRRAGVDPLEGRHQPVGDADLSHVGGLAAQVAGDHRVGDAHALGPAQLPWRQVVEEAAVEALLEAHDVLQLGEEPLVDAGGVADLGAVPPAAEGLEDRGEAVGGGGGQGLADGLVAPAAHVGVAPLEGVDGLEAGLLEGAPDAHDLAHGAHGGAQGAVGRGELLEVPPGDLGDHVVEGWLEARGGDPGDVVVDLVEGEPDGQLRGDLGDGEAGGLARQGRAAAHPRVELDDDDIPVVGVHRELHVAAARLHAHAADDADGQVAQVLQLTVGEGERGGDGDGVAGVDAHRVEVLDGADDDDVVGHVAHDLELELLPPEEAGLDEHLGDRRQAQALGDDGAELLEVPGDAAPGAAEGEGGADDGGQSDLLEEHFRLGEGGGHVGVGDAHTDLDHRVAEQLAIFGELDGSRVGADQLTAMLLEHALLVQLEGEVQPDLTTHGGQHGHGLLPGDDLAGGLDGEGLDVGGVGQLFVGHDRGGVAVDQHHPVAQGLEGLAGLGARVVELAGLADDDGAGADDQQGGADRETQRGLAHAFAPRARATNSSMSVSPS